MRLEGWHIIIIIAIAILLFGAPKLPGLARSVGQSLRIFKSEVKQMKDENNTDDPDAQGSSPVEGKVVNPPHGTTHPRDADSDAGSPPRQPGAGNTPTNP
ncbi:Sec-independent protein translocase subunit TatA [Arthrobacter sp. H5]|uniref:Sec-independent protein translocase subunit TatA n=1 Tax=Arthrobacter sp. H5 TaxID=1267973 RepID=UPI000489727F|nr:Sec-independent protein translocase subunit TatA [Arthrobacter sp. H5]